jgi:hypothetical protein
MIKSTFAQQHYPCRSKSKYPSNWTCVGPFNDSAQLPNQHFGIIHAISVNPNNEQEIYIGTGTAGLFHTSNQGKDWKCLTDSIPFPIIGIHDLFIDYSKNPHTIILATGSTNTWYDNVSFGLVHSIDGGRSWQSHSKKEGVFMAPELFSIVVDSIHNCWYTHSRSSIYRVTNHGKDWQVIFNNKMDAANTYDEHYTIQSIQLNKDGSSIYFTTSRTPVWDASKTNVLAQASLIELRNCNGNISNIQSINHTAKLNRMYAPVASNPSTILKACKGNFSCDSLFILQQYEATKETTLFTYNMMENKVVDYKLPNKNKLYEDLHWFHGLAVNTINPFISYIGFTILYKSVDTGNRYLPMYNYSYGDNHIPHADIRCIYISSSSKDGQSDHIYLGTDGGLSFSEDGGRSFRNLNGSSLPITQFYGFDVSPFSGIVSAGSQDNSIFSYEPQSKKWSLEIRGDGYDVAYSKTKPGLAFGQYNNLTIYKTENDIAPFTIFSKGNSILGSNKKNLATHQNGNTYFADISFHILRSNKENWEEYPLPTPHQTLAFAVSRSDSNIIYLSSYWNKLFKSTDGGKHFSDISNSLILDGQDFSDTRIHAICISPYDANKIWISIGYLGDYTDICKQTKRVLFSQDGGNSWMNYSEGLPVYYVSDLVFYEGSSEALFASTFEGIYFCENRNSNWELWSNGLPKCLFTEMQISYCRNKLMTSTYGRGLWESDLPSISLPEKTILTGKNIWKTENEKEAMYFTNDIILKKNARLDIHCPVYIAKNKTIFAHKKSRITFHGNGKFLNDCNESWGGIQIMK